MRNYQLNLGDLIKWLSQQDPDLVIASGFSNPDSYRGYYEQLAFAPASNVTIGTMLAEARSAVGQTFEAYKGGDYLMDLTSLVNISHYGTCGACDAIRQKDLDYMLVGAENAAMKAALESYQRGYLDKFPDALQVEYSLQVEFDSLFAPFLTPQETN